MNITDVGHIVHDADTGEDKMSNSAKKEGKTAQEIAEFYTEKFLEDLDKMYILIYLKYQIIMNYQEELKKTRK